MSESLDQLSVLVETDEAHVVVSDLDGVLRRFDQELWEQLDEELGAAPGTSFAAILGHPFLEEVTRGRGTHAQWRRHAAEQLASGSIDPALARRAVDRWASTPAQVDQEVLELLQSFRARGIEVFVFTNGTDRVPEELDELGLTDFIGPNGRSLLNSADLGAAKPERAAFEGAHQRIERITGEQLAPRRIAFLDDSSRHVRAAREFGWAGIEHRPA